MLRISLVTNARRVQRNGRGRKGDREPTNSPVGGTKSALVTNDSDRVADAWRPVAKMGLEKWKGAMRRKRQMTGVMETASVCGRRAEVGRRRSGAFSEAQRERNGNAEPQTEAMAGAVNQGSPARDERGFGVAEQAWSRRETGPRPEARAAQPSSRWSRRMRERSSRVTIETEMLGLLRRYPVRALRCTGCFAGGLIL
jgi:hypothetical protein